MFFSFLMILELLTYYILMKNNQANFHFKHQILRSRINGFSEVMKFQIQSDPNNPFGDLYCLYKGFYYTAIELPPVNNALDCFYRNISDNKENIYLLTTESGEVDLKMSNAHQSKCCKPSSKSVISVKTARFLNITGIIIKIMEPLK